MNDHEEQALAKGRKLFEQERYQEAISTLSPIAHKGNRGAQSLLGLIYQFGLGVDRDVGEAIQLLTLSAKAGCGEAAHNLGTLYLACDPDLPVDREKSKYWYNEAKVMGFVVAPDEWYN